MMRLPKSILMVGLLMLVWQVPCWGQDQMTIVFQVTRDGLTTSSIPLVEKKMHVRQGTPLKLVFQYADSNRNAHQFSLVSSQGESVSGRIAADGAKLATLQVTAGQLGEAFYRLSCELPCIAMDQLTDYLIIVDQHES